MGISYSIYRFGHHNLRDNNDYQLFILELKECYTTEHFPQGLSQVPFTGK